MYTCSEILLEVRLVEPSNFVVGGPQLAGLIDIDLASLLSICLSEFLANLQSVETSVEDASLAAHVSCTIQAERASKVDLCLMKHVAVRIIGEIEDVIALPVRLESLCIALRKCRCWRCVIWERVVINVFTLRAWLAVRSL